MKKRKKGRKLSRKKDQRKALLKSLANAFILKEKIKTTEAKAKEVRSLIEKSITLAKSIQTSFPIKGGVDTDKRPAISASLNEAGKKDLAARRQLLKIFPQNLVKKLIEEIAPRYRKRQGGYIRIIKLGGRESDGAKMAIIEFVK